MNTKLVIGLALLAILVSVVSILVCQKYLVFPKKEVKKEVNNNYKFFYCMFSADIVIY